MNCLHVPETYYLYIQKNGVSDMLFLYLKVGTTRSIRFGDIKSVCEHNICISYKNMYTDYVGV